jgi:ankyrin repeat protein
VDPRDRALYLAIEQDQSDELRDLLDGGTPPTYIGEVWTPLHHAVDAESDFHTQTGVVPDLRLVRLLLDAGAEVNAVSNVDGRCVTPLDIAFDYANEAAIDAIMTHGGRRAADIIS